MANDYFDADPLIGGEGPLAKRDALNQVAWAVQAAFDLMPSADWFATIASVNGTVGGTANAITLALGAPAPTSYTEGLTVQFRTTATNTGAVTLNINSIGAAQVVRHDGVALSAGDLMIGLVYEARYNATSGKFELTTLVDGDLSGPVTAAEAAQAAAELAQAAAETAQGLAEDAQAAAETAQGLAEDAQADAETAAAAAAASAQSILDVDAAGELFTIAAWCAINGSFVVPGWAATPSGADPAAPDYVEMVENGGTGRKIKFVFSYTSGLVTQIVVQLDNNAGSYTTVTGGTLTIGYDGDGYWSGTTAA